MTAAAMQLEDWLDDLCVRFIINLPQEDLSSVARICFQVEEAQWFYEDFIRPLDLNLPSMSLRTFCLRIFQHCPLLASFSVENHTKAFEEFLQYKTRVPVRGAIMLNQEMDSVVLVKGWKKGANWSFPRGKINKDEDDLDCAVREVYEETGLDLRAAGLVPTEKKPKYIEISMREQQLRLYVFRDIPMDTKFQPRTRKEISKIEWYKLSELPAYRKKGAQSQNESSGPAVNKFYMVAPFLLPLKKWIMSQKKMEERRATSGPHHVLPHYVADEAVTTEDDTWAPTHDSQQQTPVPAIETLDGATRELQRLLKMQPSTQGLQPQSQPQEDKGSALLSILQSNNARPAAESHQSAAPHTPLHATSSDAPQPRNPHHHTNLHHGGVQTQHPPPSFPISQSHETPVWDSAMMNQLQHSLPHHPEYRQQQQQQQQMKAAHEQKPSPQPHSSASPLAALAQQQQSPAPQHSAHAMTNSPLYTNMSPGQAASSSRGHQLPAASGAAKLSGASLALLDAFKRDTVPAATQSPPKTSQADPAGGPSACPGRTEEQPQQAPVSELVGSYVPPAADQHRSNLLGMFKKSPPGNVAPTQPPPAASSAMYQSSITAGQQGPRVEKVENIQVLLQQVQQVQQVQGNGGSTGHHHLSLERLSLQTISHPSAPSSSPRGRGSQTPHQQQPAQQHYSHPQLHRQQQQKQQQKQQQAKSPFGPNPSPQQPPPAPRILQRGQDINDLTTSPPQQRTASSPRAPPFAPQPAPVHTASGCSSAESRASHQPVHGRHQPDGSRDQKKQLLSLFGKQQAGTVGQAEAGELPRSKVSSVASRGGEMPISPAEQTFLLGYLQSVTNNAGRR
ncbi:hypothetical protein E4U41_000497 [Claviceps citrina]|nr:hypothetical protein E4U41_000497 [Claviceps citrina]